MGPVYKGSREEKEKYDEITNVKELIDTRNIIHEIEKECEGLFCVELAVTNCGEVYDEDVEVSIHVPKDITYLWDDFQQLSDEAAEYLEKGFRVERLFGIQESAEIESYNNIRQDRFVEPDWIQGSRYYEDKVNYQFAYDVFQEDDKLIIGAGIR